MCVCVCIPGKLGFVPLLLCSLMMCANNRGYYGPMVAFVCLPIILSHHRHHYADISENIELLKCLSVHSVECVSQIKSILSVIFHEIYGAMRTQLAHFFCDDCENTGTLSH